MLKIIGSFAFTVFVGLAAAPAHARSLKKPSVSVAQIERTVGYDLGVEKMLSVEFVNVLRGSPVEDESPVALIRRADIVFKLMVSPLSCNTAYATSEILTQVTALSGVRSESPSLRVELGTVRALDSISTCVGLPAREARLVLPLINGIDEHSTKTRFFRYEFAASGEAAGEGDSARWIVVIKVNPEAGVLEVHSIKNKR